ncbi:hypothetical protein EMCRGX_G017673 [Ephydatia muelleri]
MLEKAGADVTALQVIRSLDQQRSVMMDVEQYKMQNGTFRTSPRTHMTHLCLRHAPWPLAGLSPSECQPRELHAAEQNAILAVPKHY